MIPADQLKKPLKMLMGIKIIIKMNGFLFLIKLLMFV